MGGGGGGVTEWGVTGSGGGMGCYIISVAGSWGGGDPVIISTPINTKQQSDLKYTTYEGH